MYRGIYTGRCRNNTKYIQMLAKSVHLIIHKFFFLLFRSRRGGVELEVELCNFVHLERIGVLFKLIRKSSSISMEEKATEQVYWQYFYL